VGGFVAEFASAPDSSELVEAVVIVSFDCSRQSVERCLMLFVDTGDGNSSGSLLSDEGSESGLVLHDTIWNLHLSTESREPNNQLNRVDIVGDNDKLGLLLFNEGSDMVDTELDEVGSLLLGGSGMFFGFFLFFGCRGFGRLGNFGSFSGFGNFFGIACLFFRRPSFLLLLWSWSLSFSYPS